MALALAVSDIWVGPKI